MMNKLLLAAAAIAIAAPATAATVTVGGTDVPGQGQTSSQTVTGIETFDAGPSGGLTSLSATGNYGIFNNSVANHHAAPADDSSYYFSVPDTSQVGTATLSFPLLAGQAIDYLGLYWGSMDDYNTLEFLDAESNPILLSGFGYEITGNEVRDALTAEGHQTDPGANKYINIFFGLDEAFTALRMTSSNFAFEVDNIAWRAVDVPEPAAFALFGLGLGGLLAARRRRAG